MNTLLCLIGVWFALLDRCVIVSAEMPVSYGIAVLLLLQASTGVLLLLLINGAFPVAAEMATDWRNFRLNLVVFGIPLIIFVVSPAMISDSMYEARYGIDKFVVQAHVVHDLRCCLNPFAHPAARSSSHR